MERPDQLLTQQEVAARLRLTVEGVRYLRKQGRLAYLSLGWRSVRIRADELERFITESAASAVEIREGESGGDTASTSVRTASLEEAHGDTTEGRA